MIFIKNLGKFQRYKNFSAFTLAEVLIVIGIIGIIAEFTIPTLVNKIQIQTSKTGAKIAYSLINNALKKVLNDNSNYPYACYYWQKNPYGSATCVNYSEEGNCTSYKLADGSNLPSDYNGLFSDCGTFMSEFKNNLSIIKSCAAGTSITNGCMPEYKGNDSVYQSKNTTATQYDLNKATSGCSGWRTSNLKNKESIVLKNGMIIIPYSTLSSSPPIIAIDINGKQAPNKFGHDVMMFYVNGSQNGYSFNTGGCEFTDLSGHSTSYYLYQ